ncbi:hypothetical protein [Tindallia californiensis]|uniref:PKD domain-containing protein n=1 Tax=Tindallia californiensis TaxID=159292 RepID=A0A1H3P6Q1_9FIRM|nr:hypothetical protein [Tindallia californiensis]SDY96720.1 hypothetical protein SAMN05192546_10637 [Tindallia californiensis]
MKRRKILVIMMLLLAFSVSMVAHATEYYEGNNAKLRELAEQWLNENPDIRNASPQDKADFMTRKYMEQLQRDNAPLDSTYGDSFSRTVTGTTDRMVNCSTHYLNLSELFRTAGIDDRRMGQVEATKTGIRGTNLFDVNRNHGTITVLGDDNVYRTYDVWIHAKEREEHNDREDARVMQAIRRGSLTVRPPERHDVYGDVDNSRYIGMPVEDWSQQMNNKGYRQYEYRSHATHYVIDKEQAEGLFISSDNIGTIPLLQRSGWGREYTIVSDNAGDAIRIRNLYDYNNELDNRRMPAIARGLEDPGSNLVTPLTTDPVFRVSIAGERHINDPEGSYAYAASVSPAGEYLYEWRFGESTRTGGATINISYDHLKENTEVTLGVRVANQEGKVLTSGEAAIRITFDEEDKVAVTIDGDPVRIYFLEEDEDYLEHSFSARASQSGNYTYEWSFGDGRSWSQTPGEGRISGGTITYEEITDNASFILGVRLKDEQGEVLGRDQMTINVVKDEDPEELEEREDIMARCNEWYESGSGGAGTTRTTYDISSLPVGTSFEMRFDAYSIPDRFIVEYEGAEVYNSGWRGSQSRAAAKPELYPGGVSGAGSGSVSNIFTKNEAQHFTVTVIGPEAGTAWQYALRANCPEMLETEEGATPAE